MCNSICFPFDRSHLKHIQTQVNLLSLSTISPKNTKLSRTQQSLSVAYRSKQKLSTIFVVIGTAKLD